MPNPATREVLRKYFGAGAKPTGDQFAQLIESFVNPTDDGIVVKDGKVGIGVGMVKATEALDVQGNIKLSGVVTAAGFKGSGANLTELDAGKITSGVLSAERIPTLDASKITSGVLSAERIPMLDAGKIASGVLSAERIPTLDAGKITGVLNAERIPTLDAGKITSGVLSAERIPGLDAGKITSGALAIERGGTGSNVQNFVDLSTAQTIRGVKNFANKVVIGADDLHKLLEVKLTGTSGGIRITGVGGSASTVALDLATFDPHGNDPSARIIATDDGMVSSSIDFQTRIPRDPRLPALKLASRMLITSNGNIGIGTTDPTQAKLVVTGGPQKKGLEGAYINADKAANRTGHGDDHYISIYSEKTIWAGYAVIATSDERIKEIEGQSDHAQDLQVLLGIEITNFRYKDVIGRGNAPHKKVIAQQVEKVFPQAVSVRTDVVPDIYQQALIKDGWVELATDLRVGDRVKLIAENGAEGIHEVLEVMKEKFRTDFKPDGEKIFVFGREVNDFRTVDYDAISMLNVSATQELHRRIEQQAAAITARDHRIAELEQRLATLEAHVRSSDDRIRAIETMLASVPVPASSIPAA